MISKDQRALSIQIPKRSFSRHRSLPRGPFQSQPSFSGRISHLHCPTVVFPGPVPILAYLEMAFFGQELEPPFDIGLLTKNHHLDRLSKAASTGSPGLQQRSYAIVAREQRLHG